VNFLYKSINQEKSSSDSGSIYLQIMAAAVASATEFGNRILEAAGVFGAVAPQSTIVAKPPPSADSDNRTSVPHSGTSARGFASQQLLESLNAKNVRTPQSTQRSFTFQNPVIGGSDGRFQNRIQIPQSSVKTRSFIGTPHDKRKINGSSEIGTKTHSGR